MKRKQNTGYLKIIYTIQTSLLFYCQVLFPKHFHWNS